MKLQDIINADFANLIHSYKDIELQEFKNGILTIKCNKLAREFIKELQEINQDLENNWIIELDEYATSEVFEYFITIR